MLYFSLNLPRAICLEEDHLPKTSQFYPLTAKFNIHVKIQYNCSITDVQFEQKGPLKVINVLQYQTKKKVLERLESVAAADSRYLKTERDVCFHTQETL